MRFSERVSYFEQESLCGWQDPRQEFHSYYYFLQSLSTLLLCIYVCLTHKLFEKIVKINYEANVKILKLSLLFG